MAEVEKAYPDAEKGKATEKAAMEMNAQVMDQNMPIRQYLDTFIVPTLNKALTAVAVERPDNPVEWIAHYLLKNKEKPDTGKAVEETAAPAAAEEAPKEEEAAA